MPEGDTVHRTARRLHDGLSGRPLTGSDFRVPGLATTDLTDALVVETVARGKHLLTRLRPADRDPVTLHTHLKMEGHWQLLRAEERWRRPAHTARVVLDVPGRRAVGFALGVVELVPTAAESTVVGHLGPDLLGPDWDEAEALRRLRADPAVPVFDALRDQRRLAGIGTMYAAELCFTSGVAPITPVGEVPQLDRLVRRAWAMLAQNVERPVQATTGDLRPGRRHWVYRRDRQPCRRCGTPVRVRTLGESGRERAAYWCPSCQPG